MGFIRQYFRKKAEEVTKEDVDAFISRKIEENINLDYKDIQAYSDFAELSKDVSAFANSEGGLLILGVSQEEIREGGKIVKILPKDITWGEQTLSKEQLEDNFIGKIKSRINDLKIQPIREGNDSMKVIFLLDIPQSNNRPHMASDKRYHRRVNFRRVIMEHDEVVNFIKLRWTLREKMIEKIYEPLASILRKNAKQLSKYQSPFTHEIEEIMSRTYYTWQMPHELFEEIDYYLEEIKELDKKEHFARKEMKNICYRNVFEYLEFDSQLLTSKTRMNFQLGFKNSKLDLHILEMYELLIKNETIKEYASNLFRLGKCEKVLTNYENKEYSIGLDDFNKLIWRKCLEEVAGNQTIIQFKNGVDALLEEAFNLIDHIITTS